jgi:hypothetical protein
MIPNHILTNSFINNLPAHSLSPENYYSKSHKKPWAAEEDNLIRSLVSQYGAKNWTKIAKYIPDRQGKQCR